MLLLGKSCVHAVEYPMGTSDRWTAAVTIAAVLKFAHCRQSSIQDHGQLLSAMMVNVVQHFGYEIYLWVHPHVLSAYAVT